MDGCTIHATYDSQCVFCILHGLAAFDAAERAVDAIPGELEA